MQDHTALVVGVTGIVGRSLAESLLEDTFLDLFRRLRAERIIPAY